MERERQEQSEPPPVSQNATLRWSDAPKAERGSELTCDTVWWCWGTEGMGAPGLTEADTYRTWGTSGASLTLKHKPWRAT